MPIDKTTTPFSASNSVEDIVVFGAGSGSEGVQEAVARRNWRVAAYIDNNPALQGGMVRGLPVFAPEQVFQMQPAAVVAASMHQEAMAKQLVELGFPVEKIWFYGYSNVKSAGQIYRPNLTNQANPKAAQALEPIFKSNTWKTLQIGLTDACNLFCAHCSRTPRMASKPEFLSLPAFTRYLQAFDPAVHPELLLSDFGETTLVPELPQYLLTARNLGWKDIGFFTNGATLFPELFENLIGNGLLTSLTVSVEAVCPDMYRRIRGRNVNQLLAFLAMVRDIADVSGSPFKLKLNVTCMRMNENEWEPILELAARYRACQVNYACMFPFYTDSNPPEGKVCVPEQQITTADPSRLASTFASLVERGASLGVHVEPAVHLPNSATNKHTVAQPLCCPHPLAWTQVGLDGSVYPCCQVGKRYSLGNAGSQSFQQILRSPRATTFYAGLLPAGAPLEPCRLCGVLAGYNY